MENHGGVSKTAANIIRIIKATDPKWVGALVDFGNFPIEHKYEEVEMVAPYALAASTVSGATSRTPRSTSRTTTGNA